MTKLRAGASYLVPRRARVVIPQVAHHIIQRGNYQQYVFEQDNIMIKEMRIKIQKELAVGELDFIMKLEKKFKVILRELKQGRPRKEINR